MMNLQLRTWWCWLLMVLIAAPVVAQGSALGEQPHLTIENKVAEPGKPVPRVARPAKDAPAGLREAIALDGRRLSWLVGDKPAISRDALAAQLARDHADPANWREDPRQPDQRQLLPVLIRPSSEARWDDVVDVIDLAYAAGFNSVHLPDTGAVAILLLVKSVRDPVRGDGLLIVPKAAFSEPDEPDQWRPVVHVQQDGWIVYDGQRISYAAKDSQGEALARFFAGLAKTAADELGDEPFGEQPNRLLKAELLVQADKWARWPDVHRVLLAATACRPAFWRIAYAVGDVDNEARVRAGEAR